MDKNQNWDIVIDADTNATRTSFKEVYHYVDLLWLLVKRDFTFIYKQTVLGPVWIFLQPLFTTIIYIFIFGRVAGLSTEGLPKPLFYLSGILGWSFFSETLNKTANVFSANVHIFGKIYFPRIVVPLSLLVSNLIKLAVQLVLFFALLSYYLNFQKFTYEVNFTLLLFPFLVLLLGLLGMGFGLIFSALTTKYKDLLNFLLFGVQLLMFVTPIIYPLSSAQPKIAKLMMFNPLTSIMEYIRFSLLGIGTTSIYGLLYSVGFTIVIFAIGLFYFQKAEKNFIDTI